MSKTVKSPRKAIFVRPEVFDKFREQAKADGRVYSEYLLKLLENKK